MRTMSDMSDEEVKENTNKRYTDEERDEYVQKANGLLSDGYSVKAAGNHLGVSPQTLYGWLQRDPNDKRVIQKREYQRGFDKRKREALRRLSNGEKPSELKGLGISYASLRDWQKKLEKVKPHQLHRNVSLRALGEDAVRITTGNHKPVKNGRSPSRPMVVLIGDEEKLSNMIQGLRSIFRSEEE